MDLTKKQIKQYALNLGIDLLGFAPANPLSEIEDYLNRRVQEGRHTSLECRDIEQRVNPALLLPGVKSIITAGLAYAQDKPEVEGDLCGIVSCSAWGEDYHRVLGRKLDELAAFITERTGTICKVFVDTGPPVDRAWAVQGGLGWSGKNCALINPQFGSWVFLGNIYSQLELEPDQSLPSGCGQCELCLKACPTGALQEGHVIDPYRCISYLTQMKGFVPRQYRALMGAKLYGCDTCQQVCPANRTVRPGSNREFAPDPAVAKPDLIKLLQLSNRQFKELFGQSAAAWRGRTVLQRNAIIALGNLKSQAALSTLMASLADERAVMRGHAAWALAQMGEAAVLPALQRALQHEQDAQVKEELVAAIDLLKGDG